MTNKQPNQSLFEFDITKEKKDNTFYAVMRIRLSISKLLALVFAPLIYKIVDVISQVV